MFAAVLLGGAILLTLAGLGLLTGYILHRTGKLDEVGYDKTDVKAAIVNSRNMVRRRVAESRRLDPRG